MKAKIDDLRSKRVARMTRVAGSGMVLCLSSALLLLRGQEANEGEKDTGRRLPLRGVHIYSFDERGQITKHEFPALLRFIREVCPREGINTLIWEVGHNYQFKSHPNLATERPLTEANVKEVLKAARAANVEVIPEFNCLGNLAYWDREQTPFKLLEVHPDFEEPGGKGNTSRCYCPLHPEIHKVLFALMDELVEAFEAKALHVGLDEVLTLASPECPRCKGEDPAKLFAGEVKKLRDHLAENKIEMWMWGDRLIPAGRFDIGGGDGWETSLNGTSSAVDMIPKDVVIFDWHYWGNPPTARYFIEKGFRVVSCPAFKADVALSHWRTMKELAGDKDPQVAHRALGVMLTMWFPIERLMDV
jgi:hypothetical protein